MAMYIGETRLGIGRLGYDNDSSIDKAEAAKINFESIQILVTSGHGG